MENKSVENVSLLEPFFNLKIILEAESKWREFLASGEPVIY